MEESNSTKLIPNAENAVVDLRKLRDYCLNPEHSTGKHKARLFQSMLGMSAENAPQLRQILLEVVKTHEARLGRTDEFGQRYTLDFTLEWQNKSAVVRSGWIIETNSDIPRLTERTSPALEGRGQLLTSCYPLA